MAFDVVGMTTLLAGNLGVTLLIRFFPGDGPFDLARAIVFAHPQARALSTLRRQLAPGILQSVGRQRAVRRHATPTCLRLLKQLERRAFSLARAKTGNRIAARIAIIAMTTSNSIKVNAVLPFLRTVEVERFFMRQMNCRKRAIVNRARWFWKNLAQRTRHPLTNRNQQ